MIPWRAMLKIGERLRQMLEPPQDEPEWLVRAMQTLREVRG